MLKYPLLIAVAVNATGVVAQPLSEKPALHTPDVIAPAVLPYLACLYAERGLPLLRAADGSQITYDRGSKDCSAARSHASADAAKLLEGKATPDGSSAEVFVEQTLGDMDSYVASLPLPKSPGARSEVAVIGIPVTIEDEVQPAYARYDDCLKTQVSESKVTPETIMAKFQQAMTLCASVRELALGEAEQALAAKGWDEARRQRAATSTFARADESWLAMGRQYRDMLEKAANGARPPARDRE